MTDPSPRPEAAPLTHDEVIMAANTVVGAFGATDTAAYFACFTADADFIFYNEPFRVPDRATYEKLWASWLQDGWRVTSCQSTNVHIQLLGSAAVFAHDVLTTTLTHNSPSTLRERETIVFARAQDGSLIAVHEHLSPAPEQNGHGS